MCWTTCADTFGSSTDSFGMWSYRAAVPKLWDVQCVMACLRLQILPGSTAAARPQLVPQSRRCGKDVQTAEHIGRGDCTKDIPRAHPAGDQHYGVDKVWLRRGDQPQQLYWSPRHALSCGNHRMCNIPTLSLLSNVHISTALSTWECPAAPTVVPLM